MGEEQSKLLQKSTKFNPDSSGTSIRGKTRVSNLANKRMKADLTNAARSAVVHDPEIRIYYKRKCKEGKEYGTVLNAIKFKIITRAFAVINRKTPFVKLRQAGKKKIAKM